jgi:PAS domain S-box-containing protein
VIDPRLSGLLDAVPDAMLCVDGGGLIVLANASAGRVFGYDRDDLVGQAVEVLVPERSREAYQAHRADYLAALRPMDAGLALAGRRGDGSEFPAEISLSAIETDEGILIAVTVRDLAERRRLTAELERRERQAQESRRLESLGKLAGGVAHDFNNLLGLISSYTGFVAQQLEQQPSAEDLEAMRGDIEQVRTAAERATKLSHRLLAFGRREVISPAVVNLNEVVTNVEYSLIRTVGEQVEVATSLAPDLDAVLADPGQLEQVLVQLAANARDAMPEGGRLTIETANTAVGQELAASDADLRPGAYVAVKVSDTGTGMSPEVIDHAFEPFFTSKSKGNGSGLGLATVHGVVAQADGDVRIRSEPGLGTTITILLPVTDQFINEFLADGKLSAG